MTRRTKIATKYVLLFTSLVVGTIGGTEAFAADKPLFTCTDGAKTSNKQLCADHGGVEGSVQSATSKSKPIDTTKGLTPPTKAATTTKSKTNTKSASVASHKKVTSKATGSPTAKCNDGAMYYSTEHKGACLSHGGVDKWFIW